MQRLTSVFSLFSRPVHTKPQTSFLRNLRFVAILVISFLPQRFLLAQSWEEHSVLKAATQEVNDNLGSSVALSENYAAAGALKNVGEGKGAVHIFKRNSDNSFIFAQAINPADADQALSGHAVAMTDDFLVVGFPTDGPEYYQGSAFIFERDNDNHWNEVGKIQPSDANGGDQFGGAVAISGSTIVVAAPGKHTNEYQEGAVYVFERDENDEWVEKQRLTSSDSHRDDFFGSSVAIQDGIILVGTPNENENSFDAFGHGAVYFFEKDENSTWVEKQKIISPNRKPGAFFGYSLDIFNDEIIIGAEGEDHYGAVYFFKRDGDQWTFDQRIPSPSENSYGHDVALYNNVAVVSLGDHLSRYIFTYLKGPDGIWKENGKIYGPGYETHENEKFGYAIDIHKELLIVGAPDAQASIYQDYNPPRAGEARIYEITGIPIPFEKTDWIITNAKGSFPFLIDIDNDGDLDLFIGHDDDTRETRLYKFGDGHYILQDQRFPALEYNSSVSWIDANHDGWMDFIIRYERDFEPLTELYLNGQGEDFTSFVISSQIKDNLWEGGLYFADYDNDTDLDLLVQLNYEIGQKWKVKILDNNGKFEFTDSGLTFEGVIRGTEPWYDYNNDGFKDFFLVQEISCDVYSLAMFENQNGDSFQRIPVNIQALNADIYNQAGEMVWGDYDNDGDGDILWSGRNGCSTGDGSSGLIINNGGNFINGNLPFRSLRADVHLSLADLSNDGVLDMVVYGDPWEGRDETMFFLGDNNKFNQLTLNETPRPHQLGDIETGDIEGDGDIDVLIAGYAYVLDPTIVVYKNNAANGWTIKNERPSVPANLKVTVDQGTASVQWQASHDDTTPAQSLTYNIVLARNDSVLVNPYSRSDGKRQYYQPGNAGLVLNHVFKNLPDGDYKVAVQAIDNSYAGSEFTAYVGFATGDIVSVVEKDFDGSIQFFPNPVEDELRIESALQGIKEVHISDLRGRECYTSENNRSTLVRIPLSTFEKGVYIVTVHAESGMITRRRVVKR